MTEPLKPLGCDADGQMIGQLPLFTLDGADEYIQRRFHDEGEDVEMCKECGQDCTSSRECVEFSGPYVEVD